MINKSSEEQVENIHIRELKPILSLYEVKSRYKPSKKSIETVTKGRNSIRSALKLEKAGHLPLVMVDCSHGNSKKDHTKQIMVVKSLADQIARGSKAIMGIMIESNLKSGSQSFVPGKKHEYGKSITDACVDLDETTEMFKLLYDARVKLSKKNA